MCPDAELGKLAQNIELDAAVQHADSEFGIARFGAPEIRLGRGDGLHPVNCIVARRGGLEAREQLVAGLLRAECAHHDTLMPNAPRERPRVNASDAEHARTLQIAIQ